MPSAPAFQSFSQTLLQLLPAGQGFYVPVYQRSFTWGADHIGRLFEDIHAGLNRAASRPGPPTFLGSVILFEGRGSVNPRVNAALPAQVLHVVDGQQRLTTLLLVLGQTRFLVAHAIDELGRLPVTSDREWIIGNLRSLNSQLTGCLWVDLPSGHQHYARLPRVIRQATDTWGDRETNAVYRSDIAYYLHGLAEHDHAGGASSTYASRPHLTLAVESIDEQLARVVTGSEDGSMLTELEFVSNLDALNRLLPLVPADAPVQRTALSDELKCAIRVASFAQFLLAQVIVIDVRAPDEETAFALFEPLNTTGQPLTPIETLKPLAVMAEGGLGSYPGSRADVAFQRVARYVPDELEATERSKRVSSLLTSFALGQDGTKLPHNMLEQRRYLRTAFEATPDLEAKRVFVEGIADTASFLSDVWEDGQSPLITVGTPADRVCLEVLRSSNHGIVVPLLVRYAERAEQEATTAARSDFRAIVRATAAFWTIWRSSRTTTSGIDDVHRGLIKSGLGATGLPALARSTTPATNLPSVADVKRALRSLLSTKLGVGDAASWAALVNSQQLYETAKTVARYILLCAHDDAIGDRRHKGHAVRGASGAWPTRSLEIWRAHYSVEHIAPQRRQSTDTSYSAALYDEGDINRLGNLTLLPADLNGLVGNKPWPFKRDVFGMLAKTSKTQRVNALKGGNLYQLGAKSKALLESSDFMPFCKFVASYPEATIDRTYVSERGRRLAELAWDRLWVDLN